MRIAILHRVPFEKVRYDQVIDHAVHDVIYFGTPSSLLSLPQNLRCRKTEVADLADTEGLLSALTEEVQARGPLQHLEALSEYDLLVAAEARAWFEISGRSVADTLTVRDKVLMKKKVAGTSLKYPRFARANDFDLFAWSYPVILKPVDGASSVGVQVIHSKPELEAALGCLPYNLRSGYEIEEFISGPVLHFDGWIQNGRIQDFMASRYINTCLEFTEGRPLGSFQVEDLGQFYKSWAQKVVAALGLQNGAFHLEGILHDDEIYFLEIGHRVGGAGVAQTFELKTGINLYHAHLASTLGLSLKKSHAVRDEFFGWFVYPGHEFKEGWKVLGLETAQAWPEVRFSSAGRASPLPTTKISYQPGDSPASGLIETSSSLGTESVIRKLFETVKVVQAS